MSISATEAFEELFTAGSTSHTTASRTPTANALQIVTVMTWVGDGAPTVSGNGLTWVQVDAVGYNAINTSIYVFRAMGASPAAGALTITGYNNAPSAFMLGCVHVCEFTGVDTSGTNGSGAVVQHTTDRADESAFKPQATSLTVSMVSTPAATSATFAAFYNTKTPATAITPGGSYTQLGSSTFTTSGGAPNGRAVVSEWALGGLQNADASTSTTTQWGGVAIEIKAGATDGWHVGSIATAPYWH